MKKLKVSVLSISVIIPTYNSARTINRAIKSVQSQEDCLFEIILVDNGSNDETLAVVNSIKDERLIILKEEKRGAPFARNRGLKEAKGKYIQFLDADDELLPGKLKFQYEMCSLDNLDLIVGSYKSIESGGKEVVTHVDENVSNWLNLFRGKLGNTVSNLWRRETLIKLGGWNTQMLSSQESELMFRMLKSGCQIQYDHKPLTLIHKDAENRISDINLMENAVRYYKLRLEILDWIYHNQREEWNINKGEYSQSLFNALMSVMNIQRAQAKELYNETNKLYWRGLKPKSFILKIVYFN